MVKGLKGLKKEDELEIANSYKSGNGLETVNSIQTSRSTRRPSGRKGSGRGVDTMIARELTRASQANKPTGKVEVQRVEQVEEHEQGVKTRGGAGVRNW